MEKSLFTEFLGEEITTIDRVMAICSGFLVKGFRQV